MTRLLILIFFTCPLGLLAQKKIKTIEVSDTIVEAYIDRPGDLYIITKNAQIQKYDADGKLVILYKAHEVPTLFEPRDGARLFMYHRETQYYEYRSPSFDITKAYAIDSSFVIQPWLICTAGDHKLWVLDEADHSLKKLNPDESLIEVEMVIDSTIIKDVKVFHSMRDYQGFVFLNDPQSGIMVFNGVGKHIRTIPAKGNKTFNFLGEELYYTTGGRLHFFDLFTAETRELAPIKTAGFMLLSDQRLFNILPKTVEIFEFTP